MTTFKIRCDTDPCAISASSAFFTSINTMFPLTGVGSGGDPVRIDDNPVGINEILFVDMAGAP